LIQHFIPSFKFVTRLEAFSTAFVLVSSGGMFGTSSITKRKQHELRKTEKK
jgi:hypothetical protein